MKNCSIVLQSFLASLLFIIGEPLAIVSPFDYSNFYSPAGIYRMSYAATLTGSSSTFSVNYPKSFTAVPIILYSISSLTFGKGIRYSLTITGTTSASVTANFQYNSTVTKASFLFMAMDSKLYSANFSFFTYTMPVANTIQTINIPGHQLHDASYLVGFQASLGPFSAGYAPQVDSKILVETSNIISAALSFSYDPSQLSINSLTMYSVDFQKSSFKAYPYAGYGQQFAIYGTNGIATDTTQTGSTYYSYLNNYFVGLQAIYDGQFLFSTLSFDIIEMLNTNVYYLVTEMLFVAYRCPGNFPYTSPARDYCFSDCEIGFYADPQYMCQPCDPNCYTCYNMSKNCTSCVSPYVLVYGYVCGCIETSFQVTNANGTIQCLTCSSISGCQTCTQITNCTSCMNNLILTDPLTCVCPLNTVWTTIGMRIFCVQLNSTITPINENCTLGMVVNYTACACPKELNLTLINGTCSYI